MEMLKKMISLEDNLISDKNSISVINKIFDQTKECVLFQSELEKHFQILKNSMAKNSIEWNEFFFDLIQLYSKTKEFAQQYKKNEKILEKICDELKNYNENPNLLVNMKVEYSQNAVTNKIQPMINECSSITNEITDFVRHEEELLYRDNENNL